MQRQQRLDRRPVGTVDQERPAEAPGRLIDQRAVLGEAAPIGGADRLSLADDMAEAGFGVLEFGAAGIGEGLFDRVEDLHEMSAGAGRCDCGESFFNGVDRIEEVGEDDEIGKAAQLKRLGPVAEVGRRHGRGDAFGGDARQKRSAVAEQADAFAAAGKEFGEGEGQNDGAAPLVDGREARAERHRGGEVRRKPQRMGRLPFLLADIEMLVARGAAPVDRGGGLAGREGAELPEGLARPGAAAAMPAGEDGRGDAACFDKQRRHGGAEGLASGSAVSAPRRPSGAAADIPLSRAVPPGRR